MHYFLRYGLLIFSGICSKWFLNVIWTVKAKILHVVSLNHLMQQLNFSRPYWGIRLRSQLNYVWKKTRSSVTVSLPSNTGLVPYRLHFILSKHWPRLLGRYFASASYKILSLNKHDNIFRSLPPVYWRC